MKVRKRLSKEEAKSVGLNVKSNESYDLKKNPRYSIDLDDWELIKSNREEDTEKSAFDLSAWTKKGKIMNIDEFCVAHKLNRGDISSWRLCTHTKVPTYNITFKENKEAGSTLDLEFISEVVKKNLSVKSFTPKETSETDTFDRFVFSDVHIGMDANKDGYALYEMLWNEDEIEKRRELATDFILKNKSSDTIYIDELGDFLDGWDGQTTRKGHALPQNMDNQKAFDVAVSFKVRLVDSLINSYSKIVMNNVCEDNHSGSFGYVVNSAVKSILEGKYPESVTVVNHRKFISHYYVGNHAFILSHGKDSKNLKFGFKPQLDAKQSEKIDQYCKVNNVYKNSSFIEFSKGDSHQMIFDYATSDDFDYCSYPAFSPSSEWVQVNFKKGRSGCVMYNIDYDKNNKNMNPLWFN